MKTTVAIIKAKALAAEHRHNETFFRAKAARPNVQDPELKRRYLGFAKREKESAETLELLSTGVTQLHRELTKTSGMLHYCTFAPPSGIELSKDDVSNIKAQLKVTKYLLKIHKP